MYIIAGWRLTNMDEKRCLKLKNENLIPYYACAGAISGKESDSDLSFKR